MPTHAGKEGIVKIGTNQIAEVRSFTLTEEGETVDSTSLDNTGGWRTHKQTLKSWGAEIECFWDETDSNGQVAMDNGASIVLNLYPEGDASGDNYFTGTATITKIETSAAIDGMVEAKFSCQGNGVLSRGDVA